MKGALWCFHPKDPKASSANQAGSVRSCLLPLCSLGWLHSPENTLSVREDVNPRPLVLVPRGSVRTSPTRVNIVWLCCQKHIPQDQLPTQAYLWHRFTSVCTSMSEGVYACVCVCMCARIHACVCLSVCFAVRQLVTLTLSLGLLLDSWKHETGLGSQFQALSNNNDGSSVWNTQKVKGLGVIRWNEPWTTFGPALPTEGHSFTRHKLGIIHPFQSCCEN